MKKTSFIFALVIVLALTGCNLPSNGTATQSPDAAYTQAAQNMAATLTALAQNATPTSNIPTNTPQPTATNTPVYTPTYTAVPCNMAAFISDVTYPDNTVVNAGATFTKIWRLKNIGTCTWTTSYKVTFEGNTGMGKASGYSQSLGATVPPNQTVDISVDLTAPAANGTYTGSWALRDPDNNIITSFIVVIKVATSTTVILSPVAGESGTIRSTDGPWGDFTIGESNADITKTVEAFLSFNISAIPTNATITDVKLDFRDYSILGNPFGLGTLNAYVTNYGTTLEPADFVSGFPGGNSADWGSTAALDMLESSSTLASSLQSKLGTSRFQLRLQFAGSNLDAVKDRVTLNNPTIVIIYVVP